ncbi:unnamed protein product [Didymodactylos carnosus]|uniref:T4 RNA ligase 1 C-terminal domain-containing protein n=1 Tax=Didymodactylos carnosus TaxID=1234261 RepID=A0A815XEF0_9BILA|nr:unnamed protein product [Didymodactylos carnosus]CAF1556477.1 unnamed protein product [Didymodactylos carnosus]CAF3759775.1 unnamed protein product [Didymodactylos carnosus]CAF4417645.1 unnamed protein product [Didymodactylos carnosus]
MLKHMVPCESLHDQRTLSHEKLLADVRSEQTGEGYVVEIIINEQHSYLVKIKNTKYLALHHTKDSVNHPQRLFEAIINESSDDLKAMFSNDPTAIDKIVIMEEYVKPRYNQLVETIEQFYVENKHLSRKEYAQKAQKLTSVYMSLLMNLYMGKTNNYKEFAIRHSKGLFEISEEFSTPK